MICLNSRYLSQEVKVQDIISEVHAPPFSRQRRNGALALL